LHEKAPKKCHSGIIAQLHSIHATETPFVPLGLQSILYKHQVIFPLPRDFLLPVVFMIIPFPLPNNLPPNVCPYHHPFVQKNEIEKIVQELLATGVIHPRTITYSFFVVMVLKKEGSCCTCPNFHTLNKLTIKEKFPIPVIDDLLDELSGA
jgi:hypothetical protein